MNSAPLSESSSRRGNGIEVLISKQRLKAALLRLVLFGSGFGPACGPTGKGEHLTVIVSGVAAVVCQKVDFNKSSAGFVLLDKGPDRYLPLHHRVRLGARSTFDLEALLRGGEYPVDGRSRDGEELRSHLRLVGAACGMLSIPKRCETPAWILGISRTSLGQATNPFRGHFL